VHSFVGLASYYRSFVPNFSIVAAPLLNRKKRKVPFVRDEKCQDAFIELKKLLTSALVLAAPRDGRGWVIDVDACDHGLGAVFL